MRSPVTLVQIVISGLVVAFAILPVNPLAFTKETSVTVPPLLGAIYFSHDGSAGSATSICPLDPTGRQTRFVPLCTDRSPFVVCLLVLKSRDDVSALPLIPTFTCKASIASLALECCTE